MRTGSLVKNVGLACVCAAAMAMATPAWAHKVIASVFASGDKVEGEIGFSNGDMAAHTVVEVFDGTNTKIGEAKTDADGVFSFRPTQKVDHVFRANLGAGHVAEARMAADELPGVMAAASSTAASATEATVSVPVSAAVSMDGQGALHEMVAEAVRREVKPLRHEIASYKEKNDMQAILGGIGYIVGLFGVGFYVAARRKETNKA